MQNNATHRARQRGLGLIDAMIAVVIFALGVLGVATLYLNAAPSPYQNAAVAQAELTAQSFMTTAYDHASSLPISVSNATSSGSMPAGFQGWFSQAQSQLPGLSVTVTSGTTASGAACSPTACGLTLRLSWKQMGSTRTQTFYGQIGLS